MEPIDLKEGDRVRVDGIIYRLRGDGPVWELSSEEGEESLADSIRETERIRARLGVPWRGSGK